jgi:hypothetical protein
MRAKLESEEKREKIDREKNKQEAFERGASGAVCRAKRRNAKEAVT